MPDLARSTLLLGADDSLTWDVPGYQRNAVTLLLELIHSAHDPTGSKGLLYLGNATATGGRFGIRSSGTQYLAYYHNGTSEVTSTMTSTPVPGEHVWLRATRDAEGRVQIHQHIGWTLGVETSAAQSGTLAIVAYGEPCQLRLNGLSGAGDRTTISALRTLVAQGEWTLAGMVNRF